MKEDHGFVVEEENVQNNEEISEEVKSDVIAPIEEKNDEVVQVKEEIKQEVKDDKNKESKKKINIGLIFLGFVVVIIAFIYIFLGKPTLNFSADSGGESFYITFSKLEEKKKNDEEEKLDKIVATDFQFKNGLYIEQNGLYLERGVNTLNICYSTDIKCYIADIKVTDKTFYEDGEETKAFTNEYVDYINDNGDRIRLETNFDGVRIRIGDKTNKYLNPAKSINSYDGLYKSGDKYIALFTTYDYLERLNQVSGFYYDGNNYGKFNFNVLVDTNKNNIFDDMINGNIITLSGKLDEKDEFSMVINHNNNNLYEFSFNYKTYNELTGQFENVGSLYNNLIGTYSRTY